MYFKQEVDLAQRGGGAACITVSPHEVNLDSIGEWMGDLVTDGCSGTIFDRSIRSRQVVYSKV